MMDVIEQRSKGPWVRAVDANGEPLRQVEVGDALAIRAEGLPSFSTFQVIIRDKHGAFSGGSLISDKRGAVAPTVIWPQLGIDDPRSGEIRPILKLVREWFGQRLEVLLVRDRETLASTELVVSEQLHTLIVSTNARGELLNGFEVGSQDVRLSLFGLEAKQTYRIWMVPRQHEWQIGDQIRPVLQDTGRAAHTDFVFSGDGQTVVVADRKSLGPGAYDFILRLQRYGYEDDDLLILTGRDHISNRRATGLVIREKFMASKVVRGGCINLQEIACRRTLGNVWPYVQYSNTFQVGEDVWGVLDPNALDPMHTGKAAALYIVPHKTAAQWTLDNSLNHLATLGGNANTLKWVTQSWCANANLKLIWPNATLVGDYDVVVDFGNNAPTLAGFVPDHQFNMPLDMIDGYIVPGFRIVPDPGVDTGFSHFGTYSYSQPNIALTDDFGMPVSVPVKATVFFPADVAGTTLPGQISASKPNYPVVVCVHGNSNQLQGYLGYNYLLQHLALNGFIAVSIHMEPGQTGTDRAMVLKHHLDLTFASFGAHAANNVGIMGHSRGGEAVAIAARLNQQQAWGYNINAVISLAPTNQYTNEHLAPPWGCPYFVLYGSSDGDLAGIGNTGFELYDHASGIPKSMAFVYRACHDRFNTVWGSGDFAFGKLTAADQAVVLSDAAHQTIAKGYMTAFFRQHLRAETQWSGIFKGEWVPASSSAADPNMRIYTQYEDTTVRTLDHFEGAHTPVSWQTSSIGGTVSHTGLPVVPQEGELRSLDGQSPHLTGGLAVRWDGLTDKLSFSVPVGQRDVSAFEALSFRIGLRVGSAVNTANTAQDLRVTLTDGTAHSRAIRVSKLDEIPYPHVRGIPNYTKSAMCTIRIPLAAYHIHCLNVDKVDLHDITVVEFEFAEKITGEVEIDSIQFTD